ncbi:replication initiation and membrane attachment family protein [Bacillus taeanensis]|uniref:Replication initiation and membrane attachment protein n=1 Tax=Bacillus taeanensis TaxID=273032 RepID=A0A366Y549_9BACI|nr:DnaD domain protein [Bacillus taeanensis]RBW71504.1 Replication initiation and membrane attachment protein [Bacillus taeanensis]
MSTHWKELLPVDRFQVRSRGILHDYYRQVITSLYQPLIGALAYSLYMTFWSELDDAKSWSEMSTHRSLMNLTQLNLQQLLEARKKLEAVGLLKTYVKKEQDAKLYVYELEAPFTPEQFYNDGALNVYLYNRLGSHKFHQVKQRFIRPAVDEEIYDDVTASFNDVFISLHPSELMTMSSSEIHQAMDVEDTEEYIGETSPRGPLFVEEVFDFDLFLQGLSTFIVPKESITSELKGAIIKLAYVYKIEPIQMKEIVESAFINREALEVETLRKAVQDWYVFEHDHRLPSLSHRTQPPIYQEFQNKNPETEEEKAIALFEAMTPFEQLERIGGGAKPAPSDIKLVESLMFDQHLQPGVVNVLIEYVMRTNDMKLIKSYVEKIAAHWARKKVKTVRDAMILAKAEHKKYQDWVSKKQQSKEKVYPKRNERREQLPKWMTEKKTEKLASPKEEDDFEEQKRQLEERLKKYKQNKS